MAAIVIGMVGLAACSQLPPTHYYVLEIEPAAEASATAAAVSSSDPQASSSATQAFGAAAADELTIGVRPFVVDPPYDQERIVYRVGERSPEIGFYTYHLWAAPLSSMLPAAVAAGLEGAAGIAEIEPAGAGGRYDAYLLGRVLAVEEIDVEDRQQVRASIELRLVSPDGEELWTDRVEARGETQSGEVEGIVEAIAQALAEALAGTRERLGSAVSRFGG